MSQLKQGKQILPLSTFSFYSGPRWIGRYPLTLVRAIFSQSTDSNANLIQKPPQRHISKWCFTSSLGIPQPNQVDIQNYTTNIIKLMNEVESPAMVYCGGSPSYWSQDALSLSYPVDGHKPHVLFTLKLSKIKKFSFSITLTQFKSSKVTCDYIGQNILDTTDREYFHPESLTGNSCFILRRLEN